jgi:hypothetical protein
MIGAGVVTFLVGTGSAGVAGRGRGSSGNSTDREKTVMGRFQYANSNHAAGMN